VDQLLKTESDINGSMAELNNESMLDSIDWTQFNREFQSRKVEFGITDEIRQTDLWKLNYELSDVEPQS
jgi:hypothetical protein